jgi:hypothetical protein
LESPKGRSTDIYLSQAYEHDKQLLMEQKREEYNLALEVGILHERLTSTYRRLVLIAGNENVSAKDRIDAEAASCEVVALAITKLTFEDPPIILKGFSAYICGDDDDLAQLELKNQRLYLCLLDRQNFMTYVSAGYR